MITNQEVREAAAGLPDDPRYPEVYAKAMELYEQMSRSAAGVNAAIVAAYALGKRAGSGLTLVYKPEPEEE